MFLKTTRRELLEYAFKRGLGVAALAQLPLIKSLADKIEPSKTSEPTELKILSYLSYGNQNRALMSYYQDFSDVISSASKGSLKVSFLTLEQVDKDSADTKNPLEIKGVDGFHLASSFLNHVIPGASLFTEVTDFNQSPLNPNQLDPAFLKEWQIILAEQSLSWHPFAFGSGCGLWSKKPINTLEDLQNLRIRTHGVALSALQNLGSKNSSVGKFTRKIDSFRGDEFDAMEGIMPYFDYFMGMPDIAKNFYTSSWPRKNTQVGVFLKQEKLKNVSQSAQNLLAASFTEFNNIGIRKARFLNIMGRAALKTSGVEVKTLPSDIEALLYKNKIEAIRQELSSTAATSNLLKLFESRLS